MANGSIKVYAVPDIESLLALPKKDGLLAIMGGAATYMYDADKAGEISGNNVINGWVNTSSLNNGSGSNTDTGSGAGTGSGSGTDAGTVSDVTGDTDIKIYKIKTLENMLTLISLLQMSDGDILIVSEKDVGGTFIYDSSKKDINDGGIVLNGAVRKTESTLEAKWFGLKADNTTDNTQAFQKALDSIETLKRSWDPQSSNGGGRKISLPAGKIIIKGTIKFKGGITIEGAGALSTIIRHLPDNPNTNLFEPDVDNYSRDGFEINNFVLSDCMLLGDSVGGNNSDKGVDLSDSKGSSIVRCGIYNFNKGLFYNRTSYYCSIKDVKLGSNFEDISFGDEMTGPVTMTGGTIFQLHGNWDTASKVKDCFIRLPKGCKILFYGTALEMPKSVPRTDTFAILKGDATGLGSFVFQDTYHEGDAPVIELNSNKNGFTNSSFNPTYCPNPSFTIKGFMSSGKEIVNYGSDIKGRLTTNMFGGGKMTNLLPNRFLKKEIFTPGHIDGVIDENDTFLPNKPVLKIPFSASNSVFPFYIDIPAAEYKMYEGRTIYFNVIDKLTGSGEYYGIQAFLDNTQQVVKQTDLPCTYFDNGYVYRRISVYIPKDNDSTNLRLGIRLSNVDNTTDYKIAYMSATLDGFDDLVPTDELDVGTGKDGTIKDIVPMGNYKDNILDIYKYPNFRKMYHDIKKLATQDADVESQITGTKYYFSIDGDDANDGLTEATPKKSLSKIFYMLGNANAGDAILFKRGDVWTADNSDLSLSNYQVTGDAQNSIFISSYGDKLLSKPKIDGMKTQNTITWTQDSNTGFWYSTDLLYPNINITIMKIDGEIVESGKSISELQTNPKLKYFHDTANSKLWISVDPSGKDIMFPDVLNLLSFKNDSKNLDISNLDLKNTRKSLIVTVKNNEGLYIHHCRLGASKKAIIVGQNAKVMFNYLDSDRPKKLSSYNYNDGGYEGIVTYTQLTDKTPTDINSTEISYNYICDYHHASLVSNSSSDTVEGIYKGANFHHNICYNKNMLYGARIAIQNLADGTKVHDNIIINAVRSQIDGVNGEWYNNLFYKGLDTKTPEKPYNVGQGILANISTGSKFTNNEIHHNVFYKCDGAGILLADQDNGACIDNKIYKNTMIDCGRESLVYDGSPKGIQLYIRYGNGGTNIPANTLIEDNVFYSSSRYDSIVISPTENNEKLNSHTYNVYEVDDIKLFGNVFRNNTEVFEANILTLERLVDVLG